MSFVQCIYSLAKKAMQSIIITNKGTCGKGDYSSLHSCIGTAEFIDRVTMFHKMKYRFRAERQNSVIKCFPNMYNMHTQGENTVCAGTTCQWHSSVFQQGRKREV